MDFLVVAIERRSLWEIRRLSQREKQAFTLNPKLTNCLHKPVAMKLHLRPVCFASILVGLLLLDCVSVVLAYHTIGEVISGLYLVAIALAHVAALGVALVNRRAALITAATITVLALPFQLFLGVRWWRIHREAERIIAYAEDHRQQTGAYPTSLTEYAYHDRYAQSFFRDYQLSRRSSSDYSLSYRIGTPSTSHTYSPRNGWSYYAD